MSWSAIRPTLDCPFFLEGITIPPPTLKTISTNSSHLLTLPGYLAALLLLLLATLFLCYARHSSTLLWTDLPVADPACACSCFCLQPLDCRFCLPPVTKFSFSFSLSFVFVLHLGAKHSCFSEREKKILLS